MLVDPLIHYNPERRERPGRVGPLFPPERKPKKLGPFPFYKHVTDFMLAHPLVTTTDGLVKGIYEEELASGVLFSVLRHRLRVYMSDIRLYSPEYTIETTHVAGLPRIKDHFIRPRESAVQNVNPPTAPLQKPEDVRTESSNAGSKEIGTKADPYLYYKTREEIIVPFRGPRRILVELLYGSTRLHPIPIDSVNAALDPEGTANPTVLAMLRSNTIHRANLKFKSYNSKTSVERTSIKIGEHNHPAYYLDDGTLEEDLDKGVIIVCGKRVLMEPYQAKVCKLMISGLSESEILRKFFSPTLQPQERVRFYDIWSNIATALRESGIFLEIDTTGTNSPDRYFEAHPETA